MKTFIKVGSKENSLSERASLNRLNQKYIVCHPGAAENIKQNRSTSSIPKEMHEEATNKAETTVDQTFCDKENHEIVQMKIALIYYIHLWCDN
jgi:hypothetical protein